jgi:hypothetical protein
MDHLKKDLLYLGILMLLLFIGWIVTGGPQKAQQTGSDHDKYQQPIAPIGSGQTYNSSLKNISPVTVTSDPKALPLTRY